METQLDKFGRVLIPKAVRDHLGLKTGSVLYIEEKNQSVVLKVAENTSSIKIKEGIAIYDGRVTDNIEDVLVSERSDRLDKLQGK